MYSFNEDRPCICYGSVTVTTRKFSFAWVLDAFQERSASVDPSIIVFMLQFFGWFVSIYQSATVGSLTSRFLVVTYPSIDKHVCSQIKDLFTKRCLPVIN